MKKKLQMKKTSINNNIDNSDFYDHYANSTNIIIISTITPILIYFLIKKYTDDILSDPKCNCVLEKYITDIKNISLYLIITQVSFNILRLLQVSPTIIIIGSLIAIFLQIKLFICWFNITSNIKKNKCKCANTKLNTIINIIIWFNIIFYSLLVLFLLFTIIPTLILISMIYINGKI
tara:strand:- start:1454 stop:1984 length:531 start_codon:yes stop_codon:yes gene_type:complete